MCFSPFPHSPSEDRNGLVAQIFPWKCEFRGFSTQTLSGQATAHKQLSCLWGTLSQVLSNTFFLRVSFEDLMAGEGGGASLCFKHILCRRDLSPPTWSTGISSNVRHTWWPAASGHMCPKMTVKLSTGFSMWPCWCYLGTAWAEEEARLPTTGGEWGPAEPRKRNRRETPL